MIRAVVFDFDGTLTAPGSLDFSIIKDKLGCPPGEPVLEFVSHLEGESLREAHRLLDEFEYAAAAESKPNAGAEEVLEYLRKRNIPFCIVSRNSRRSILRALENFPVITADDFQLILSRDDEVLPKPDPAAIRFAARSLGFEAGETLSVGDYIYDVEAGCRAGAWTAYLTNGREAPGLDPSPDYLVDTLTELELVIRRLSPLPAGKLPNLFLAESLRSVSPKASVLIGPGVGEDVAAVEVDEDVLVLKSDPITFASQRLGYHAVIISANDIATAGAEPRWLLSTLLLPLGSSAAQAQAVIGEVDSFCERFGIALCGGHTEVTDSVTRPVVVAQLAGTVSREHLVDKRRISAGDQVLLTKGIAIEGTAILAGEYASVLIELGLSEEVVKRSRRFGEEPGISILEEARAVARIPGVTGMHDVTEGGIATALEELAAAGDCGICADPRTVPILPETEAVCQILGLDPLGLIASGSLLLTCVRESLSLVQERLGALGIPVSRIGEVTEGSRGLEIPSGSPPWPRFETDEITRALHKLKELNGDLRGTA